jgi:hypothetical protein
MRDCILNGAIRGKGKAGPYIMNFSPVDVIVHEVHRNMFVRHGAPASKY